MCAAYSDADDFAKRNSFIYFLKRHTRNHIYVYRMSFPSNQRVQSFIFSFYFECPWLCRRQSEIAICEYPPKLSWAIHLTLFSISSSSSITHFVLTSRRTIFMNEKRLTLLRRCDRIGNLVSFFFLLFICMMRDKGTVT